MLFQCKKKFLKLIVLQTLPVVLLIYGFTVNDPGMTTWLQQCISESFDPDAGDVKLKKFDLHITPEGFFRLKKFYPNGKQEYFSFHIKRFKDMDYLGDTLAGVLSLRTVHDDIIVQTYNDKKGNIDSMTSLLQIPVRNMEPGKLDSLHDAFTKLK